MAGAGHGPGCHSQLPSPPPLDTGYWRVVIQHQLFKISIYPCPSIQRHCVIWTLEACVYVLWVSVLKSNVSLFTVRVGPPSSVISRALSHYCITHWRWAGVWWVRLRAESDKKKYQNTGAHVYSGKWSRTVCTVLFFHSPERYARTIVIQMCVC